MMILLNLAAALAAVTAAPLPVDMDATASKIVHFDDLNLASVAGERRLHLRIANAARQLCGDADIRDLKGMESVRQCRDTVRASARPQIETALASAREMKGSGGAAPIAALVAADKN
jgi:UrcA family protein